MNFACVHTIKSYSWSEPYHISPVFENIQKLEGSLGILLWPELILTEAFQNILNILFVVLYDGLPIFANSLA